MHFFFLVNSTLAFVFVCVFVNRIHFGFDNVKYQNTFMTFLHSLRHH